MASRNSAGGGTQSASITVIKNAYFEAMREVAGRGADKVPDGWFTVRQWSEKIGISHSMMIRNMNKLIEAGKAEAKFFNVQQKRRVVPVRHCKLVI